MCGQYIVRSIVRDNTGQNTDKEIKISDPTGDRTQAAGLEGRVCTDHVIETDH